MIVRFITIILVLNVCGTLFSLWSALFGPTWGIFFGVGGFCITWFFGVALVVHAQSARQHKAKPLPGLVRHFPRLKKYRRFHGIMSISFACCAALGLVMTFCIGRLDGVCADPLYGNPIFIKRAPYEMNNHGRRIEVSRLRYVALGTSFIVCWHSIVIVISLLGLYYAFFGELPLWMRKK